MVLSLSLLGFRPLPAQSPGDAQADSTSSPAAREQLNLGVKAYKAGHYYDAIDHFNKAATLDPDLPLAKLYLATALAQNVVPGLDTPDNLKTAQQAIDLFNQILAKDPHDVNSLKQVAAIYYSVKRFDDAKVRQKKVLEVEPADAEAAYTIGVIDWTLAHQNALKALQTVGLTDDGMGNTKAPPEVMDTIKFENTALVDEAIDYLNQAILNRPHYDDAMAYLNLVYRRKADLDWTNELARQDDLAKADALRQKAMTGPKAY